MEPIPGFSTNENVIVEGVLLAVGDKFDKELATLDQRHERTKLMMKAMDSRITEVKNLAISARRSLNASGKRQVPPRVILIKAITAKLIAAATKARTDGSEIAEQLYSDMKVIEATRSPREFMAKAATSPAMTSVNGWASELVAQSNFPGALASLSPRSIYAGLKARGINASLQGIGSLRLPARGQAGMSNPFVGESQPIPVRQLSLSGGGLLTPHKAATISLFTSELAKASVPTIETVLAQAIAEDIAVAIDSVLLGSAEDSAVQPTGLLSGVSGLTASTATDLASACAEDLSALASAIPSASALVYAMSNEQATAAALLCPGLASLDVIIADTIPDGQILALDASDFASSADQGDLTVETDATVITDDNPLPVSTGSSGTNATSGSPHRSLFQIDCYGVRVIEDVSWCMRRSGRVAFVSGAKW